MEGQLTVGSLFSGIGGFDLGFERAGMRTVWFCEQDEFCRRVLAKHWPGVPCYPDVRALVGDAALNGRGSGGPRGSDSAGAGKHESALQGVVPVPVPYVDVLCGGFPCQDISLAGKGAGIDGARSGLWAEYARLIRELRPRYVVVENVAALLARGMGRVLGDLAACGYDAEWDCIPASAVGAPHRRDRLWLIAYPQSAGLEGFGADAGEPQEPEPGDSRALADAAWDAAAGSGEGTGPVGERAGQGGERSGAILADSDLQRSSRRGLSEGQRREAVPHATRSGAGGGWGELQLGGQWESEPDVGRVAHGIPQRVDRLRALGNSLVPQIAEWIGQRIVDDAASSSERPSPPTSPCCR